MVESLIPVEADRAQADRAVDDEAAEKAVAAFNASIDPSDWKVAVQRTYGPHYRSKHINVKEAAAIVDGVRWASRSSRFRRCRLVTRIGDEGQILGVVDKLESFV